MDLLKTPHQMLLEEAGAKIPTSTEMLKTPQQMLMEQTGLPQKFADGGDVQMSVEDMIAAIMAQGQTPQKFAAGSTVKNIAGQSAFALPFIPEEARNIAQDIKSEKYPEAAVRTAGVGYSAFAPLNPLTMGTSLIGYSPEVGDATLEGWKKQELERQMMEQYKAKLKADQLQKIKETRFYKK
jgi:hypothetical protein